MPVPATKGQLRTRIEDMEIGDYIICEYQASTSGEVGTFSNLGGPAGTEIPVTGEAAPNGSFYFVMVDKVPGYGGLLVADRVIQHSISWNTLNAGKLIQGLTKEFSLVPAMTSDTEPFGTVSASSVYEAGREAYRAFDGVISVYTSSWTSNSDPPVWIKYDFGEGNQKKVIAYSLGSSTDYPVAMPKDWVFQGSVDGVVWVDLDNRSNETNWAGGEVRYYSFNNQAQYRFYRVYILDNNRTSNKRWTIISEIGLYDRLYSGKIRSLTGGVAYADANGNSSTTDQGYGGWPTNNEFDKYILRFPQELVQEGYTLFDVFHHDVVKTWTQDTPIISIAAATNRVTRGGTTGTNNFSYLTSTTTTDTTVGFRPVLEFMEE